MRERPFTYSEIQTFKSTPRRWWLAYHRGLTPIRDEPTGAARVGARVHSALESFYSGSPPDDALAGVRAEIDRDLDLFPEKSEKIQQDGDLALAMIEGYFEWLAETGADEDFEIVGAEETVSAEVETRYGVVPLLARLDLRVRHRVSGDRLFLDHKTVQSFEQVEQTLHLDAQMKHYLMMERLAYPNEARIDGAIYNMLRRVKRTPRAKPPFYARVEIRHNTEVIRTYYRQTVEWIERIIEAERRLDAGEDPNIVAPPNPSRDCSWRCEFLPVCPMFDDSSAHPERVLHSYYSVGDPLARYRNSGEGDDQ